MVVLLILALTASASEAAAASEQEDPQKLEKQGNGDFCFYLRPEFQYLEILRRERLSAVSGLFPNLAPSSHSQREKSCPIIPARMQKGKRKGEREGEERERREREEKSAKVSYQRAVVHVAVAS